MAKNNLVFTPGQILLAEQLNIVNKTANDAATDISTLFSSITVESVVNIPTTSSVVIANLSLTQTFSIDRIKNGMHITILINNVNPLSGITIVMPTIDPYINKGEKSSIFLPVNTKAYVDCVITDKIYLDYKCEYLNDEYVDLGLPSGTLWANKNIGATSAISDYGPYFLWGDPVGYTDGTTKDFSWSTYKYGNGGSTAADMTKYNSTDGKTILDLEDDPAYMYTNGVGISPTVTQNLELYNNCTWTWTSIDGVNGYKVQSKVNENYIFLPASGFCSGRSIYLRGSDGYFWSSSLNSNIFYAYGIYFNSSNISPALNDRRYYGFSVRAVLR